MHDELNTIWHTPIITKPVAKNGSEHFGVNCSCFATFYKNKKKFEIVQFGKTKNESLFKMRQFLSNGNQYKVIEVKD